MWFSLLPIEFEHTSILWNFPCRLPFSLFCRVVQETGRCIWQLRMVIWKCWNCFVRWVKMVVTQLWNVWFGLYKILFIIILASDFLIDLTNHWSNRSGHEDGPCTIAGKSIEETCILLVVSANMGNLICACLPSVNFHLALFHCQTKDVCGKPLVSK